MLRFPVRVESFRTEFTGILHFRDRVMKLCDLFITLRAKRCLEKRYRLRDTAFAPGIVTYAVDFVAAAVVIRAGAIGAMTVTRARQANTLRERPEREIFAFVIPTIIPDYPRIELRELAALADDERRVAVSFDRKIEIVRARDGDYQIVKLIDVVFPALSDRIEIMPADHEHEELIGVRKNLIRIFLSMIIENLDTLLTRELL
jgi:hypothetical protein